MVSAGADAAHPERARAADLRGAEPSGAAAARRLSTLIAQPDFDGVHHEIDTILAMPPARFAGVQAAFKRIVAGVHWLKIALRRGAPRARARAELARSTSTRCATSACSASELDSYLAESLHRSSRPGVRTRRLTVAGVRP